MRSPKDVIEFLGSSQTNGYGPMPIPVGIDDDIHDILLPFFRNGQGNGNAWTSHITERHGFVLMAYAERMASRAIRESRKDLLFESLSALALATPVVYIKEAIPIVGLILHSAHKLGVSPQDLLMDRKRIPSMVVDNLIMEYEERQEEDRSIEAMGYIEGVDADGFRYVRTW